nr:hypothetical protein [Rubrobacter sp.]
MIALLSLALVAALAAVHLFSGRMRFLDVFPRSRWLSAAGGVSVAYVFVHLLPDLAEEQETVREAVGESFTFIEYHVYLVALVGLATFYGLERAAKVSRGRRRRAGGGGRHRGGRLLAAYGLLRPLQCPHRLPDAPPGGAGTRQSRP